MTTRLAGLDHRGHRPAAAQQLSAGEAVVAAFADLGDGFDAISGQVRELATLTRSSPVLSAWTLQIYLRYEAAIADLVAPGSAPERPTIRDRGCSARWRWRRSGSRSTTGWRTAARCLRGCAPRCRSVEVR